MSEQKRKINETDPDYEDAVDQQAKRQRVLEQDGRQAACRKIHSIIKREFQKEISDKEKELQQIDLSLNDARLTMDRLRACIVASYYGRANQALSASSSVPSSSNCPSANAPAPNIHPTVKKYIGKAPLGQSQSSASLSGETPEGQAQESEGPSMRNDDVATKEIAKPQAKQSITPSTSSSPVPFTALRSTKPATVSNEYDDRRSRFKVKKKIVIGNVSRYIQVDQREPTDMSSHKWMVYVRGPKSQPDISGFVRKVWFFLHHSYKPNDHVEISCPPFHLTRRGWGEFPVRVQLHFVDPRNKKVDIIHHLKLDKTFTGLQTMGAETVVEVELERDFFEPEEKYVIPKESCLPPGMNSIIPAATTTISSIRSSMTLSSAALPTAAATSSSSPSPLQFLSEEMMETSADVDMTCNIEDSAGAPPPILSAGKRPNGDDYNVTIQHESVSLAKSNISNMEEGETGTIRIEKDIDRENKSRNDDIQCDVVSDEFNVTIDHENEKEKQGVGFGKGNDKKENRHCLKSFSNQISSDEVIGFQARVAEKENDEIAVDAEKVSVFVSLPQQPPPSSLVEIPTFTQPVASNTNVTSQKPLPLLASSLTVNQPSIASVVVEASQNPPPSDVGAAKQIKPVSLLTSFTLEKLRQQKQVQHQQQQQKNTSLQPQPSNQQPRRKITTLNPGTAQQNNISLPTSQPSTTIQTPTPGNVRKQFTVINLADLQKKKAPNHTTSVSVIPQVATSVTNTAMVGNSHPVVLGKQTVFSQSDSTGDRSATNHLVSSQQVVKDKGHVVQNPLLIGQKLVSTKPPDKPAYQVVMPIPNPLQKVSLLSSSTNHVKPGSGAPRMVYLNPASSSSSNTVTSPPSSTSNVIRPSAPVSSKKQISLLTGLVINRSLSSSSQNKQTPDIQVVQNQTQPHSLTTPNSSSIISSPSIAGSVVVKTGGGSNQLNILSIPPAVGEPNIASNIITPCSNTFLAQTASPRIMIAYPNTLKHTREENKRESEIKMSAIGKAKRIHGNAKSIIETMIVSSCQSSSHDSEEERIRKQYQVLNAWKNNPLLFEDKGPQPLKRVVNYSDIIDGEVDIIPALNAEDYPDLVSLTQAALRLHPLIQPDVNKLTHPYCAESRDQWMAWPAGKQRAAEWHRACFTLRYLKACLGGATSFKGVQLYKTRQLVEWCRLHAFSPQGPIHHKEEPSANPQGGEEENGDPSLYPPPVNAIPQSFTKAKDLNSHLAGLTRTTNQVEEDVEILLDKPVEKKSYHKKIERDHVPAGEDNSLLNGQPTTEGAFFIHDWMRKRGIKYSYQDVEGRSAADMVFQTMMDFASDVLRKSFSVCTQKGESTPTSQLSVQDVHTALSLLPGAAFCCNTYLGKEEEEEYREGEGAGPSR